MVTEDRKGIGIIGYGGFGAFIHKAWDAMPNAHVVAVCDSNPAHKPDGVNFYSDFDDMLADPDVDIVSIATPPSSHKDLALKTFSAGKHALIEKPLALTPEDAEEIKQAALSKGLRFSVDFVLRYNPIVTALEYIASSGVFGKLRRVDLRNYAMQETVPKGHWFWNPDVSGRILLEHGVHFFDLAASVIGAKASECWSLGVEREPGMEDRVFAAVKYANGVVGTYWHSFSRPRELETTTFHFAFDLGEIEIYGWIPLKMKVWGWTDDAGFDVLESLGIILVESKPPYPTTDSSEYVYNVEHEVDGILELTEPKLDVYATGLQMIMDDLIQSIENSQHQMRVTINDAIEAVRVAYESTNAAHPGINK